MQDQETSKWVRPAISGVISAWALSGILIWLVGSGWAERGQFGDMFGAVNALFSGLAFAGVILTLVMQRQELELQREELRLTREEMKASTQAQKEAAQALQKQLEVQITSAQLAGLASAMGVIGRGSQALEYTGIDRKEVENLLAQLGIPRRK